MPMVGFPLLLIPLAIYNIIVLLMRDVSLSATLVSVPLMSGDQMPVTLGDILLALGILLLLFEVIKGARPGAKYLTDHLLSLVVFAGAAAEFLLLPRFATSTYFLLVLLALVDFLSGIALRARRGTTARVRADQTAPPEPRFDSPPVSAVPAASETVHEDRPEPRIVHAEVTPPSPEISSPGLQPGEGSPPPDAPPR
jgi:hypothetical protein